MRTRKVGLLLKVTLSIALFITAVVLVDVGTLLHVLAGVNLAWIIGALGAWIAYQTANAALGACLIPGRTSIGKVWRVNLISTYFGLFLPGDAVAGMASRLRYLGLPTWQEVVRVTITERVVALGVGSALACIVYFASSFHDLLGLLPFAGAMALLSACLVIAGIIEKPTSARGWTRRFQPFLSPSGSRVITAMPIAIAVVVWICSGLTAFCVLRSLGTNLPLVDALLFSYLITLLQLLPFFFAGIGIRDLGAITMLGLVGVSGETALATSLVALLLILLSALAGGALQVNEERLRPS